MGEIVVTDRQGQSQKIEITPGASLMQVITDAGVGELLALCGGMCSCATCHVYIDSDHAASLPPSHDDEEALLSCSEHRQNNSRLSCQVRMSEELDGLRVTVAPED